MIQKDILNKIKEYNTIIIHHHISPDPDCLGSQLGLKYIIKASFPKKEVYAAGSTGERTSFMGEMDEISDDIYKDALVIIVDVGDEHRVDDGRFNTGKELIKIDHHPLTKEIADLEWVDTSYPAACEMIIDLFIQNQDELVMTDEAARVLYAGLLTDTGRYYYNNVTDRTLRYGAEVYKFGFNKQDLYADLYHKSIAELKFTGHILANFTLTKNGLGYMKLTDELLKEYSISPEYASSMVNTLSNIEEVMTWIFFIEYKELGKIRVEFRSRGPIVNQLAKKYGGGGHAHASGAMVTSWDVVDHIIEDADSNCESYKAL